MNPRLRYFCRIPRADTSSFVLNLLSLSFCGSAFGLGLWRYDNACHCWRGRIKVRKDAVCSLIAVAFLVKGAYTVVVVGACFAFIALPFQEIQA